eukprot:6463036-Amphidinium_carterae.1
MQARPSWETCPQRSPAKVKGKKATREILSKNGSLLPRLASTRLRLRLRLTETDWRESQSLGESIANQFESKGGPGTSTKRGRWCRVHRTAIPS